MKKIIIATALISLILIIGGVGAVYFYQRAGSEVPQTNSSTAGLSPEEKSEVLSQLQATSSDLSADQKSQALSQSLQQNIELTEEEKSQVLEHSN